MNTLAPVIPEGLKKVPPFPPVAAKLLTLLSHPDVEVPAVAELISSDPSLTARLLQYVNSALLSLGSPITDVRQSVALVGLDRTRQITVMSATATYAKRAPHNAELQSCWQHSLATAVLADEIAKSYGAFTKIVFTAGILHDIGRLGLMVAYPEKYARVIRAANGLYVDILDLEREQFGIDHAEAGQLLTEAWELPRELCVIAGRHHDPCEGDELNVLRIIHVACRLANVLGYAVAPLQAESDVRAILDTLPSDAGKRLQNPQEELRTLVDHRIQQFV